MTYRPESYAELVSDAAAALLQGVNAGLKRMEVEFPPIPTNIDGGAPLSHSAGTGLWLCRVISMRMRQELLQLLLAVAADPPAPGPLG
jgi:hypothetical protein